MTWPDDRRSGFTMAEVLAAMLFLSILIPVVVEGLSLAGRGGTTASREAMALQLADNQLTELVADGSWVGGNPEGDFGDDWPGYQWSLDQGPSAVSDLVELTLHVDYAVQGRTQRVSLSTLVVEDDGS